LSLTNLSTQRQRIAELARTKRSVALSTLHHVIDLEWMQEAYRLTRKDGAFSCGNWHESAIPTRPEYLIRRGGKIAMRNIRAVLELRPPYLAVVKL